VSLEELKKKKTPRKYVIKTKKKLHKGFLFGHVSNGGGIVDVGEGFALKFTAHDDSYVTIELIDYGKYNKTETQTWSKKTIEKRKQPQIKIKKSEKNERKSLFD